LKPEPVQPIDRAGLEQDYRKIREMIFGAVPSFEHIVKPLGGHRGSRRSKGERTARDEKWTEGR